MITVIVLFIFSLFLNYSFMKWGYSFILKKKVNNKIQDIHFGFISRLGGLSIFICSSIFILIKYQEYKIFLALSLIILLPALIEDLNISIKPILRLIIILLGSFLIINHMNILPQFEFGILNLIVNNNIFQIIFFTLAIATVINGQNIIDGTNGLSAFTSMSIFSSIWYLGYYLEDYDLMFFSFFIITLLASFLLFNYPFGKLFLGDFGSYYLGLLASYLIIKLFANNPELPSWSAVIILFYPTLEVLFSYFRKLYDRQSPFLADNLHLHLKIHYLLSGSSNKRKLFNSLVAPFLSIIWLTPLTLLPFSIYFPHLSLMVLFLLILVYLFFYYSIPSPTQLNIEEK